MGDSKHQGPYMDSKQYCSQYKDTCKKGPQFLETAILNPTGPLGAFGVHELQSILRMVES